MPRSRPAAALVFTGQAGEGSRLPIAAADSVLEAASDDRQLRAYLGMTRAFAEEWPRARQVLTDLVSDCQRWAPAMLPYPLVSLGWLERMPRPATGSGPPAAACRGERLRRFGRRKVLGLGSRFQLMQSYSPVE